MVQGECGPSMCFVECFPVGHCKTAIHSSGSVIYRRVSSESVCFSEYVRSMSKYEIDELSCIYTFVFQVAFLG